MNLAVQLQRRFVCCLYYKCCHLVTMRFPCAPLCSSTASWCAALSPTSTRCAAASSQRCWVQHMAWRRTVAAEAQQGAAFSRRRRAPVPVSSPLPADEHEAATHQRPLRQPTVTQPPNNNAGCAQAPLHEPHQPAAAEPLQAGGVHEGQGAAPPPCCCRPKATGAGRSSGWRWHGKGRRLRRAGRSRPAP